MSYFQNNLGLFCAVSFADSENLLLTYQSDIATELQAFMRRTCMHMHVTQVGEKVKVWPFKRNCLFDG